MTFSGRKEIPASNYSPALECAVPSSWRFLTIVFGMGTCVSPSLWTPEKNVKEEKKRESKATASMNRLETNSFVI